MVVKEEEEGTEEQWPDLSNMGQVRSNRTWNVVPTFNRCSTGGRNRDLIGSITGTTYFLDEYWYCVLDNSADNY